MWLNTGLCRKITKIRSTPVMFLQRNQARIPWNRCSVLTVLFTRGRKCNLKIESEQFNALSWWAALAWRRGTGTTIAETRKREESQPAGEAGAGERGRGQCASVVESLASPALLRRGELATALVAGAVHVAPPPPLASRPLRYVAVPVSVTSCCASTRAIRFQDSVE